MDSAAALANLLASLPTYVLIVFVVFGFLWIQNKQIAIQRDATERSLRAVEEANRTHQTMQQVLQQMLIMDAKRTETITLTAASVAAQTKATGEVSSTLAQTLPSLVTGSATAQSTSDDVKEILAMMIKKGVKFDALVKEITSVTGDVKTLAQYVVEPTAQGKKDVLEIADKPAVPTSPAAPAVADPVPAEGFTLPATVVLTAAAPETAPA